MNLDTKQKVEANRDEHYAISITLPEVTIKFIDRIVKDHGFSSRSRAIAYAIEMLRSMKRGDK